MSGFDSKDTTSLNTEVPDFLENINKPINGIRIGIIKEFNLADLDSKVQERFEESKKTYEK